MKNLVVLLVMLLTAGQHSYGQVKIGPNTKVNTRGNVYLVLKNSSLVNNGTFVQRLGDGTVKFTGENNTSISGNGTTVFDKLAIAPASGATTTLAKLVSIKSEVTIASGQLISNGFLTLRSDSDYTARIAPVTSTANPAIAGNVHVERYIPGKRKYRLITSSVSTASTQVLTTGQEAMSIWGNWQNSGNNTVANNGTFITGGTANDGFDTQTGNASLYTYDDSLRRYSAFTSAKGNNTKWTPLKAGVAYFMFIYGDRKNSINSSTPNKTVLHEAGTVLTGDQTYTTASSIPLSNVPNRFTLLGNPFASPINWATISKTNLADTYWGWDPNLSNLGGYVTVNTAGNITLVSPYTGNPGLTQYIQPGQGFFVRTTGASPQLIIEEQDKAAENSNNAFRPANNNSIALIAINLLYNSGGRQILADGALAAFNENFKNEIAKEDAAKMEGTGETISIVNRGELLSIDARKFPVETDTLPLAISRLSRSQYTLQVFTQLLGNGMVQPYLHDSFVGTTTPLSLNDTNRIAVNISSNPASYRTNRFSIVFKPYSLLPVTFKNIKATKKQASVYVEWEVATTEGTAQYIVERSLNGSDFIQVGRVAARVNNGISQRYNWLDVNAAPGINYYRIRSLDINGNFTLSKIVSVDFLIAKPVLTLYPNPAKNNNINVQLHELPAGNYQFVLYNLAGQKIQSAAIQHMPGNTNYQLFANANLPIGTYYLKLETDHFTFTHNLIIAK